MKDVYFYKEVEVSFSEQLEYFFKQQKVENVTAMLELFVEFVVGYDKLDELKNIIKFYEEE